MQNNNKKDQTKATVVMAAFAIFLAITTAISCVDGMATDAAYRAQILKEARQ